MKVFKVFRLLIPTVYLVFILFVVAVLSTTHWANLGYYDQNTPILAIRYGTHLTANHAIVEVAHGKVVYGKYTHYMFSLSLRHLTFYGYCTPRMVCGTGSYLRGQ